VISTSRFTAELSQAGVRLQPADESLLTAHYAAPGGNGDIEYRRFLEDLNRARGTDGKSIQSRRPAVALTQNQSELLARGKAFMEHAPK